MADAAYTLATWLSPAYPVGAYTYSHGLEWAVSAGYVSDAESCAAWISDCVTLGAGRTDAIVLSHAWRASVAEDRDALAEVAELAAALAPSAERLLETQAQGAAFSEVTTTAWRDVAAAPYPVVVGQAAATHGITLEATVPLYLQAFVSNLVSAAIRLVPLGQSEGQRIVADLMRPCLEVAEDAIIARLDDIGGCAIQADISSFHHETQTVRLFRS